MCRPYENSKILPRIGQFFLARNDGDIEKTAKQILAMEIREVYETNYNITIVLRRPGLIIGKRGVILEELSRYIECKIAIIEDVKQDVNDFIIPYPIEY